MTTKLSHRRAFNQKQAITAQVITWKRFFLERPYSGSNYCTLSGPQWDQSKGCGLRFSPGIAASSHFWKMCLVEWQQNCLWELMFVRLSMLVLWQVATSLRSIWFKIDLSQFYYLKKEWQVSQKSRQYQCAKWSSSRKCKYSGAGKVYSAGTP